MKLAAIFLLFVTLQTSAHVKIIHLNIGQGDATIIIGPTVNGIKKTILVDTGNIKNPDAGKVITAFLKEHNIKKLDAVILTHYDADHIGGLVTKSVNDSRNYWGTRLQDGVDAIRKTNDDISITMLVDRGESNSSSLSSATFRKYKEFAASHPNRVSLKSLNDVTNFKIELGDGAVLEALSANGFVKGSSSIIENVTTENERSLSFLLTYKNFHYYVGGDVTGRTASGEDAKLELAIVNYLESHNISLDAFQVNLHGADNGSSKLFLDKSKPKVAIISAGNADSHEHPTFGTLERLANTTSIENIYVTAFGNTLWDDSVLIKNGNSLTSNEKSRIETITKIRQKLIILQGDIHLTTDGHQFTVFALPKPYSAN
ncbi:MBL fold metallo-hydrolase [Crocosphaera sp.]|uniref:ComEC/Rec2 family competence protein n=1 Tax=Crocosphaera sp. TaxID=2729996 RepID=UPI00257C9915|nr:MBL fold metallo-hydrolase [Crocosphaera sp.]NQZ62563.1 MBL fold metallo-hydrolase [Crocosphaera sp.]